MKFINCGFKSGEEGKGSLGCIVSIFLVIIIIFVSFKLGPPYFSHYEFKGEVKHAVSRYGARAISDENIKKDLINLAEKNKVLLKNENIQIRRFAGQLILNVEYSIPVDFLILKRDISFKVEESSFTAS
jgi:hypothetical protein